MHTSVCYLPVLADRFTEALIHESVCLSDYAYFCNIGVSTVPSRSSFTLFFRKVHIWKNALIILLTHLIWNIIVCQKFKKNTIK